jgi:ATP-binding protein involved in chromosome partitioning
MVPGSAFLQSCRKREFMNEIKHIIAVASGKGGVGKSTTAVNLALALKAQGLKVGLLDADIYGPSQQLMLGVAEGTRPDQRDGQYLIPVEAHGLKTMSMGYLVTERTPMVWRGPMAGGALAQMLEQTLWGELDYLVIDMPPGTGDIQLTLSQKARVAGAVIVTTPQDIALMDAQKGIEMFRKVDIPILGVVENMAVHICSECGHREHIFGADGGQRIASEYGVTLLGSLPLSLSIREQTDSGRPTVIAEPDSAEAAIYLEIAAAIHASLSAGGGESEQDFPAINISDD